MTRYAVEHTMGEDSPKQPLDYDGTATVVTVRGFRTLLLLTLLNTAMLGWFTLTGTQGPQFVQRQWESWKHKREVRKAEAAMLALQQKCMTHSAPADQVIYTEDPQRGAALMGAGSSYSRIDVSQATVPDWPAPVERPSPAYWNDISKVRQLDHGFQAGPGPLAFLHERKTPSGQQRLVAVYFSTRQRFSPSANEPDIVRTFRRMDAAVYTPFAPGTSATWTQSTIELRLPQPDVVRVTRAPDGSYTAQRPPSLTVFAGQPDPVDPTHFTVAYDIAGQGGVVDGWVLDKEVILKPRNGIPRFEGGNRIWELGVGPTTASTTGPARRT
jgi:hypothetical protein